MVRKLAVCLTLCTATIAYAQPAAIDLGTITGDTQVSGPIAPNEVIWFMMDVPVDATLAGGTYIDYNTNLSDFDTEIGLYDAIGNLVANNDDDGIGLASTLTFGSGSGLMLGDSFNLGGNGLAEGENGDLPAGTYYLALGEFNVTFNPTNWDVISDGVDVGGIYTLDIYTNVPEPASLSLMALGALALLRRR
jgi:hypothetical protein